MNESAKAFLEAAKGDPELCEKLAKMSVEDVIAVAKERGVQLTEADFKAPAGEIGDEELGNVVGGGGCWCLAGGGGGGIDSVDLQAYGCACVAYGQGGDGNITDANCVCAGYGSGKDGQDWIYIKKYEDDERVVWD